MFDPHAIHAALAPEDPVATDTYWICLTLDDGSLWLDAERGGFGGDLDPSRVRQIAVYVNPVYAEQFGVSPTSPLWVVPLGAHQTFIAFKARAIRLPTEVVESAQDGDIVDGMHYVWATVFGWKQVVNGLAVKSYVWLMHDGRTLITDHDIRFEKET
jgi:hypothetical protein